MRPRHLQESAVFFSPAIPFFVLEEFTDKALFFYWIPLKRHIANTMAKSCGKQG